MNCQMCKVMQSCHRKADQCEHMSWWLPFALHVSCQMYSLFSWLIYHLFLTLSCTCWSKFSQIWVTCLITFWRFGRLGFKNTALKWNSFEGNELSDPPHPYFTFFSGIHPSTVWKSHAMVSSDGTGAEFFHPFTAWARQIWYLLQVWQRWAMGSCSHAWGSFRGGSGGGWVGIPIKIHQDAFPFCVGNPGILIKPSFGEVRGRPNVNTVYMKIRHGLHNSGEVDFVLTAVENVICVSPHLRFFSTGGTPIWRGAPTRCFSCIKHLGVIQQPGKIGL